MAFEMRLQRRPPLLGETDPRRLARLWCAQIGYTARKGPDHGVSFRVLYDGFLRHPSRAWTVEELAQEVDATQPSIYRHLNKLKDLDLVEDLHEPRGTETVRAYRLRYGDLGKAWRFTEVHLRLALEGLRDQVDRIVAGTEIAGEDETPSRAYEESGEEPFEIRLESRPPPEGDTEELVRDLLWSTGYIARRGSEDGVAYRLFDCFLKHPKRDWTIPELATASGTTVPSIYRHLPKLRGLGLLETRLVGEDGARKAYRLRGGDLGRAWHYVEVTAEGAIADLRATVEHLWNLVSQERPVA